MPELPEVVSVVRELNKSLIGQEIISVDVNLDKMIKNTSKENFIKRVSKTKIINITNIAKHIIFELSNNEVMIFHLRLEGKFKIYSNINLVEKHDYVTFTLGNGKVIAFYDHRKFATIHIWEKSVYLDKPPLSSVGPTPFDIDGDSLFKKIHKKATPIKTVLLDQTIISGLGNIYVNEVLWESKINPARPTKLVTIEEINKILLSSRRILDLAISMGGSTISTFTILNESEGGYQKHLKVHLRKGLECESCKNKIEKMVVGGRGTYFCPVCQKY